MNSSDPQNKLTSDAYDKFLGALEGLYIKGNSSARIMFTKEWPQAAFYIFGSELIEFDTNGTQDRARRTVLEMEAEARRGELEEIIETLEEKSVEKHALQLTYVEGLVKKLGRDLSLLLYSPKIVDRFIPPPQAPVTAPEKDPVSEAKAAHAAAPPATLPPADLEDMMDKIKPISLEPAPSPPPASPPQEGIIPRMPDDDNQ